MAADDKSEINRRLPPYVKRPVGPRDPPGPFSYKIHASDRTTASKWEQLCALYPSNARACYDHLARNPKDRPKDSGRLTPLTRGRFKGTGLFQYEVTKSARIWFWVDDDRGLVVLRDLHVGHPKATE
jgi:hypothetical protein